MLSATAQFDSGTVIGSVTDSNGATLPNGRSVTYYRPPLARSTSLLNFRFLPVRPDAAGKRGVLVLRPDGYFSRERDPVQVNGAFAADEPTGLPVRDSFVEVLPGGPSMLRLQLRNEQIPVQVSPDLSHDLAVAEFLR